MIINSVMTTSDSIRMIDTSFLQTHFLRLPMHTVASRNTIVAGWGTSERGRIWWNITTKQTELFNGSGVVILG